MLLYKSLADPTFHQFRCVSKRITGTGWRIIVSGLLALFSTDVLSQYDLRLASPLGSNGQNEIILRLADCSDVADATITSGVNARTFDYSEAQRVSENSQACEFSLLLPNSEMLDVSADVTRSDGLIDTHAESYVKETNAPDLGLSSVGVQSNENGQSLVVIFDVGDDVDISYLDVSISALRASDIRENEGIIEGAMSTAFAATDGLVRLWPSEDEQGQFNISLPVNEELSDSEVLRNGVVLVDATTGDSSGNTQSFSTVTFTGDSVSESASALTVIPDELLFTDLLESAVIVPQVNFEFRGLTSLPGAGRGVTYTSSHPDIVSVTSDGTVYPLREAGETQVSLSVTYADLDPVVVPVRMDFSRQLASLRVDDGNSWELPGLNQYFDFPEITAVFDDGSEKLLTRSSDVSVLIPEFYQSVLSVDEQNRLRANVVLEAATEVEVQLRADPGIATSIAVTSIDAPPEIVISAPATASPGDELKILAEVQDDTGIDHVEYLIDGVSAGLVTQSPYELTLIVPASSLGRELSLNARAIDSSGQVTQSNVVDVRIQATSSAQVPSINWEAPLTLQRVTEGSEVTVQFERVFDNQSGLSAISYVDLFLDDQRIKSINYPLVEEREVRGQLVKYEVWKTTIVAPSISTPQASQSLYAKVFSGSASERTADRIITIVEDASPSVQMLEPVEGATVAVGAQLPVVVQFTDDTADQGLTLSLLADNIEIDTFEFTRDTIELAQTASADAITDNHVFYYEADEQSLGRTVELSVRARDLQDQISETEPVAVQVRADQAPQVALAFPTPGTQLIAGVPVELRAEASDDVKLEYVEFFVDGQLIGADSTLPYTWEYESAARIPSPQSISIWAVAMDSSGQSTRSAELSVTLGPDEQPPVVNIVAPTITETEAGEELAPVIENTAVAFKIAGFDNVKASGLQISGIKSTAQGLLLTGNTADIVTEEQFPLQQIPGALNAYSALKIIKVPALAVSEESVLYPVSATVTDAAGNSSTADIQVAVTKDLHPQIQAVLFHRESFLPQDELGFDVTARDDVAIEQLDVQLQYLSTTGELIQLEQSLSIDNGLISAPSVQETFTFDLSQSEPAAYGQSATVTITARDTAAQISELYSDTVLISSDESAPDISIFSPLPGSVLFTGNVVTFKYKAQDDTYLSTLRFDINNSTVANVALSERLIEGQFEYQVPEDEAGDELTLLAVAIDQAGKTTEQAFVFSLVSDTPPSVSIRSPAAGTRLTSGESFSANVLVSDNRGVDRVEFFRQTGAQREVLETVTMQSGSSGSDQYANASLRVPGSDSVLGVVAVDNAGLSTEAYFDIDVLADEEAPVVQVLTPDASLEVMPGDTIVLEGLAEDDIHVNNIEAVLIDATGVERQLQWLFFSREDETISITAPNPNTFGSVLVATRFTTEFNGEVQVPRDLLERSGEKMSLVVRVSDHGVNTTDSSAVDVTLLADTESPVALFSKPEKTLVAGQEVSIAVDITDNYQLSSYTLGIVDETDAILASEASFEDGTLSESVNEEWNISDYDVPAEGLSKTLQISATDSSGNTSVTTHTVQIMPDQIPEVIYQSQYPASAVPVGGVFRHSLRINDDYIEATDDSIFSVLTNQSASAIVEASLIEVDESASVPRMTFDVPSLDTVSSVVSLDDMTLAELSADNVLTINALDTIGELQISHGDANNMSALERYTVSYWPADPCLIAGVDQVEGPVDLSASGPYGAMEKVIVEPDYSLLNSSDGILKRIELLRANLFRPLIEDLNITPAASALPVITLVYKDAAGEELIFQPGVQTSATVVSKSLDGEFYEKSSVAYAPVAGSDKELALYVYPIDKASKTRGPVQLSAVASINLEDAYAGPQLSLSSPQSGNPVRPLQWLTLEFSALTAAGIDTFNLVRDGTIHGGPWLGKPGVYQYTMHYQVPADHDSGVLQLGPLVSDILGNQSALNWEMPIVSNEPPTISMTNFASYKLPGTTSYKTIIDDPQRLDYAEFWLRTGEEFRIQTELADDVALASYEINKLSIDGARTTLYSREYGAQCPNAPPSLTTETFESTFTEAVSTEYELRLTDTNGHIATRLFIVHPLSNIAPQIRFTSPADGQYIAAGTFQIQVGFAYTDDRELLTNTNALRVYANGRQLNVRSGGSAVSDDSVVTQAFASMYDSIESLYRVDLAESYGHPDSPFAGVATAIVEVPSGLFDANETVELSAEILDSDGAVGRHTIQFFAAPDDIRPEVAITQPGLDFAAIENSDFTLAFRAYDNVKVNNMEVYLAYGTRSASGDYHKTGYAEPLLRVAGIADEDAQPATTVNIDTPLYEKLIHIPRVSELQALFDQAQRSESGEYDIWIKLIAIDNSGNSREREIFYPVRFDQRPVVDITSPTLESQWVEGTQATVSVNAFDDVGIQQVQMTARRVSTGERISSLLLRKAPFAFDVSVPEFDNDNPLNNQIEIVVDAIDTYGVLEGDPDAHTASESVLVNIVPDQAPTISIAAPLTQSSITEGEYLLVQVAAIDDVGFETVELTVNGLSDGRRVLSDAEFPYEYLVRMPYGEAGRTLTLSASATERAFGRAGRSVSTINPVVVEVTRDTIAPQISVSRPVENATVVEKRDLPFEVTVSDDVKVSTVSVSLFADTNSDGVFDDDELQSSRTLSESPFVGTLAIDTIANYLAESSADADTINLQLQFLARDGAGNTSIEQRTLVLQKNSPPLVRGFTLLDSQGYAISSTNRELTEGREIVVSVSAEDAEVGVDAVRLYQAIGAEEDLDDDAFRLLSEDKAGPFAFALTVPTGRVGQQMAFRADATDIDGYQSAMSDTLQLTIVSDAAPQASIIKPVNDASVIVDGQSIDVIVEAFDDLGAEGIDRVVFYINGSPVRTVYDSVTEQSGALARDNQYQAIIRPPQGVEGLLVHAVVFDRVGNSTETAPVRIGRVVDTVAPRMAVLTPVPAEVLTSAEAVDIVVSVEDVGSADTRHVYSQWVREYQSSAGNWIEITSRDVELFRQNTLDDDYPEDPDNHLYIYRATLLDAELLARSEEFNERLRVTTRVVTPEHTTESVAYHEVGLAIAARQYVLPVAPTDSGPGAGDFAVAESVWYTTVDQFQSSSRSGALLGAWSNINPLELESQLGYELSADEMLIPATGLMLMDQTSESWQSGNATYVQSDLLNQNAEIFAGTITAVAADANFVVAAKHGVTAPDAADKRGSFVSALTEQIERNPDTGMVDLTTQQGELLVFNVQNEDNAFGLPYTLAGRVTLPHREVHGLARKDDLVLVANGYGGVQVIDISALDAPYRLSEIVPNGYVRDVAIYGQYALIAAGYEGLVVADLASPSLPIVATLDTAGIANRLALRGDNLLVSDMAGDTQASAVNIVSLSNPLAPELTDVISMLPARDDMTPDGTFDVGFSGAEGIASVLYADLEDNPRQSIVELFSTDPDRDSRRDTTTPIVVHRDASAGDYMLRDVITAQGAIQMAAGTKGIARVEMPRLSVVAQDPLANASYVSTDQTLTLEFSHPLRADSELAQFITLYETDSRFGTDVSSRFTMGFATRNGEPSYRFVEIVPIDESAMLPDTAYYLSVDKGLESVAGLKSIDAYETQIYTSPAGNSAGPDITRISPDVGGIAGGTLVSIEGYGFGESPSVSIGGQALSVVNIVPALDENDAVTITATTQANNAGPAAVEIVNENGLSDLVIGGFTFVDQLALSFMDPPVVRLDQSGTGDQVRIVGYGFHPDVSLSAYKSGDPDSAQLFTIDQQRLSLISSSEMQWVVPDFGDAYRGFVDVQISDSDGGRYLLPNALFYGQLTTTRELVVESFLVCR